MWKEMFVGLGVSLIVMPGPVWGRDFDRGGGRGFDRVGRDFDRGGGRDFGRGGDRERRINMGDAMELVQRHTGGRVIQAQPAVRGGREGYRIKVLTPRGEVRVMFVDAETGSME